MPIEGPSLLGTGVWLVPLVILATLGLLVFLTRRWRDQAQQALQSTGRALRQLERSGRQVEQVIAAFSPEDEEPFGAQARRLHAGLAAWLEDLSQVRVGYIAAQDRFRWLSSPSWQAVAGGWLGWFDLRRQVRRLEEACELTEARLAAVGAGLAEYEQISWQVAQQVQAVSKSHRQAGQALEALQQQGLLGPELEQALDLLEHSRLLLGEIHPVLRQGDQAAVLAEAEHAAVAEAYRRLAQVRPDLDALNAQAADWQRQLGQALNANAALQQAFYRLEETYLHAPPVLDLAEFQQRLENLRVIVQTLAETTTRLEAGSLALFQREAQRQEELCQQMLGELESAYRQQAVLEELLPGLRTELQRLGDQLAALAAHAALPIAWGSTRSELDQLQRELKDLGSLSHSRPPDQLARHLGAAQQVAQACQELQSRLEHIQAQHAGLCELLEQLQAETWFKTAQKVATQAAQYAPENWSPNLAVADFPADLDELLAAREHLLAAGAGRLLPEQALPERLETARRLAAASQDLRQRLQGIHTRLGTLRQVERQAQEQVEQALNTVNQLAFLVRSNEFLTAQSGQELKRWTGALQNLQADLDQREQGALERKQRQAADLVGRIEQTAAQWLQRLGQDVQRRQQRLAELIEELEQIAPLAEKAVDEAHAQVEKPAGLPPKPRGKAERLALAQLVPEFKRLSDQWQECAAAQAAIQDLGRQVLDSYATASDSRQQAKTQLELLTRTLQKPGAWPPVSVSSEQERREFSTIEAEWDALGEQAWRALALVTQLERLAARYQTLTERLRQAVDRSALDQDQVLELEQDLDDLAGRWQEQLVVYADSPLAVREIRQLLGRLESERSHLKRRCQQGALTYAQALQSLKGLHREAGYFKAAIDGDHAVDASGQVYRRR